MVSSLNIAVIGCGYWGKNHAKTLHQLGALYAVADIHPERAEAVATTYEVQAMIPEHVLNNPNIDGVVLALPPQYHTPMAIKVLETGKHVLVEKPMSLGITEAEKLIAAAQKSTCVAMTGHVLRFHPAFEALTQIVNQGDLGTLTYIHSHRLGLGKFHAKDDALWDIAPHDLSLILTLTKQAPNSIKGEGAATLNHLSDFAHLHLGFANGIRAHVFVSRLNPYRERKLTVVGDKAMAVFDDVAEWSQKLALYQHKVWPDDKGRFQFETAQPQFIKVPKKMPLTKECVHFIDCIKNGITPRTSLNEGLEVIKILEAGTVTHNRH